MPMKRLKPLLHRHEKPSACHWTTLKSGWGGVIGIAAVAGLATVTGLPLLMAPFGATAVLLFGQPASPLAQPVNVVGGYVVATAVALALMLMMPGAAMTAPLGVGVAIFAMLALRVTHPPAGAVPILAATSPISPEILMGAIALGSVGLVVLAVLHHRLPPRFPYPVKP